MDFVLCASREGDTIAWSDEISEREGRLDLTPTGAVVYRNIWDNKVWFAGISEEQCLAAVEAWSQYRSKCATISESEHEGVVKSLRDELARIGVLDERPDSLWCVLLEQAEYGDL